MSATQVEAKTRRLARFGVMADFLVEVLKGDGVRTFMVKNSLPADAKLAWVHIEPDWREWSSEPKTIWLVLESESFAPCAEGDLVPELPVPICETVR